VGTGTLEAEAGLALEGLLQSLLPPAPALLGRGTYWASLFNKEG